MVSALFPQELTDLFIDALAPQADDDVGSWQALKSCSLVSHSFRHRAAKHLFYRIQTRRRGFDWSDQIAQTQELRDTIRNNPHFRSCMRVLQIGTTLGTAPSAIHDIMDIMMLEGQIHGSGGGVHTFEVCGDIRESLSIELESSILKFVMGGTCTAQKGHLQRIRVAKQQLSPLFLTKCTGTVTDLALHYSRFVNNQTMDITTPVIRLKKLSVAFNLVNFMATLTKQSASVILSELESFVLHTGSTNIQVVNALEELLLLTADSLRTLEIRQKLCHASIRCALPWCTDLGLLPRLTCLRLYFGTDDAIHLWTLKPALQLLDPSLHSSTAIQAIEIVVDTIVSGKPNLYTACCAHHGWQTLDEDLASQRCYFLRTVDILIRVGLAYDIDDQQKELETVRMKYYDYFLGAFTKLSASASVNLNIVVEVYFEGTPPVTRSIVRENLGRSRILSSG
ncbi:hypothetical protein B0H34DRAFT_859186 [Crassisporium funariophilum]|nr:hypothetical protein B0H34DRAFT_859186 [Crassisporium funariophilum]